MVLFNNGYQVFVTSFMLHPLQHDLLKSNDELFESNIKINDISVQAVFQYNSKYQKALKENRIKSFFTYDDSNWAKKALQENIAVISHICLGSGESWNGMYQIPEMIRVRYDLYTPPYDPYIEKIQKLMDQSFESGLPTAWQKFYSSERSQYHPIAKTVSMEEEKDVLDFDSLAPFFLIPIIGCSIAAFAFLCEIFYHDFLSNITQAYLRRKLGRCFENWRQKRKFKTNTRKAKIKIFS